MPPPPRVSIIIPAYRRTSVGDCLSSLRHLEGDGVPFDVHVVLNDAPDSVKAIVRTVDWLPITVHECAANLGVGRSYNLAFAASDAPYMLGLQDDAIVEAGLLRALVDRVESAPDIGGACGLVMDFEGRVWDPGWVIWSDGSTSPRWLGQDRDPARFQTSCAVAQHGTLAMVVRRTAWESVGGFDTAYYPSFYGDVDMSIALRRRGWRIVFEPCARASQEVNGSTTLPFREFLARRNQEIEFQKHRDWLAQLPARSDDPQAITREAERIAATPPGPAPGAPTPEELALLRSRLAWTPEEMLRRERDLLSDYRTHLEALWGTEASRTDAMRIAADEARTALGDAQRRAWEAEADADRVGQERDAVHAELESIALSRTWRWASAARRAPARLRGVVSGRRRS